MTEVSRELEIGEITLKDIVDTLIKPARDPREAFPQPILKKDVLKMEDLKKEWSYKEQFEM